VHSETEKTGFYQKQHFLLLELATFSTTIPNGYIQMVKEYPIKIVYT